MTHNQPYNVYIASCCKNGGIYRYCLYDSGDIEFVDKTPIDRPMYAVINNNKMIVVLREPFTENRNSGIVTYDIADDGSLKKKSQIQSTKGEVACHVMIDNDDIYATNYISGSVIKMPDRLVTHSGKSVNLLRQSSPHTHFVCATPDDEYICVADLGLDTIFVYDKNLNLFSQASVPRGHGVRHLAFSEDGKYLFSANELMSTVSVFMYSNGLLIHMDTCNAIPKEYSGDSTVAAIRIYNGFIYVSNRGHDSISKLKLSDRKLSFVTTIDCGGNSPRDFDFVGDFLICTNENSNNVTVLKPNKDNTFELKTEVNITAPLCVCFTKKEL